MDQIQNRQLQTDRELAYENFIKYSYTAISKIEFREPMPIDLPVSEQINWCLKFLYVTECNDVFAGCYGFSSSKELVGLPLRSCWGDDKNAREILKMYIESDYTWINVETYEINKDGEELYGLNNINSTIKNHKVYNFWVLAMDITELKLTQLKLKKHQKKLEILVKERTKELESAIHELRATNNELQTEITARKKIEIALKESESKQRDLNASKDKFFRIIGHDLRNPIGQMIQISELLEKKSKELSEEEQLRFIKLLKESSIRGFKLLENLLEWAMSQTGAIKFKPESTSLYDIINENIGLLSENAKNKNIQILNTIDNHIRIHADKNMINTVIRNLLSNAIKFSFLNGKVEITSHSQSNHTNILIQDYGKGMTKSESMKLFKIDTVFSTTGTNNEKGTGIGLIICKEFIDKHNGRISVESKINKGSKFIVSIPNTMMEKGANNGL